MILDRTYINIGVNDQWNLCIGVASNLIGACTRESGEDGRYLARREKGCGGMISPWAANSGGGNGRESWYCRGP
jgi:hypothetical protein